MPEFKRATTSQKSLTWNVGLLARHHLLWGSHFNFEDYLKASDPSGGSQPAFGLPRTSSACLREATSICSLRNKTSSRSAIKRMGEMITSQDSGPTVVPAPSNTTSTKNRRRKHWSEWRDCRGLTWCSYNTTRIAKAQPDAPPEQNIDTGMGLDWTSKSSRRSPTTAKLTQVFPVSKRQLR